ncbi:MAG: hypothetical protein RLZZ210_502 [Pseudomonadota bacterium]|jgi:fused signal recognition particle receptor
MFSFFKRKKKEPVEVLEQEEKLSLIEEVTSIENIEPKNNINDSLIINEAPLNSEIKADISKQDISTQITEDIQQDNSILNTTTNLSSLEAINNNFTSNSNIDDKSNLEISDTKNNNDKQSTGWFSRLKNGLSKTRKKFNSIFGIISVDEKWLDELEETLLLSDVGVVATNKLIDNLKAYIKKHQPSGEELKGILKQQICEMIAPLEKSLNIGHKPTVMMMIGVNGAGKTTSIGKLCQHLQKYNQSILLAAGDTFRAAASEQLQAWGERNNVNVVSNSGDPASVAFDAIQSGIAKQNDVVIIDTAGRLPTQNHLLDELKKIKRVSEKSLNQPLHEIILVIDGNTGQNALQQIKAFNDCVGLSGVIVTKLDGSAKGGIIIAMSQECPTPIYFIGVGESLEDLQTFNAKSFVDALFDDM